LLTGHHFPTFDVPIGRIPRWSLCGAEHQTAITTTSVDRLVRTCYGGLTPTGRRMETLGRSLHYRVCKCNYTSHRLYQAMSSLPCSSALMLSSTSGLPSSTSPTTSPS
jgi:hypothetical protein